MSRPADQSLLVLDACAVLDLAAAFTLPRSDWNRAASALTSLPPSAPPSLGRVAKASPPWTSDVVCSPEWSVSNVTSVPLTVMRCSPPLSPRR